jgi:hypothetical protein
MRHIGIIAALIFLCCCSKLCLADDYGACCIRDECKIYTYEECLAEGAEVDPFVIWGGDYSTCDPNPCYPRGACCVGGTCSIWTEPFCLYQAGGTYLGDWTTCSPNECPVPCCKWDPVKEQYEPCQILALKDCSSYLDLPRFEFPPGPPLVCRISCDIVDPQVACCRSDSINGVLLPTTCSVESGATCTGPNARRMWGSETCTPNPCPQGFLYTGACCFKNGDCIIVTRSPEAYGDSCGRWNTWPTWETGTYLGNGSTCVGWDCNTMAPIPPTAACCAAALTFCEVYTKLECDSVGGTWFPNEPCPITGNACDMPSHVCCLPNGNCTLTTTRDCNARFGTSIILLSTCVPNPCSTPALGTCCFTTNTEPPSFTCIVMPETDCENLPTVDPTIIAPPAWSPFDTCEPYFPFGKSGACGDPGTKSPLGACCVNGMCSIVEESSCDPKNFIEGVGCQPVPCEIPTGGACCQGISCTTEISNAACTALGGFFTPYVTCEANPVFCSNLAVACCTTYGCQLLSAVDCETEGFTPGAAGSSCTPDPCD